MNTCGWKRIFCTEFLFSNCSIGKDYVTKEYNYDNVKRRTNKFHNDDFLNYPLETILNTICEIAYTRT